MLLRFRLWLRQFNLIALWIEERRLDREAKLEMVREMCEALRAQSNVAIEALQLTNRFLKNFEHNGESEVETVRNEDEVKAAALRMNLDPQGWDEFNPFSVIS